MSSRILLVHCCTRLSVDRILRLQWWSTQIANDKCKDHIVGQLTRILQHFQNMCNFFKDLKKDIWVGIGWIVLPVRFCSHNTITNTKQTLNPQTCPEDSQMQGRNLTPLSGWNENNSKAQNALLLSFLHCDKLRNEKFICDKHYFHLIPSLFILHEYSIV